VKTRPGKADKLSDSKTHLRRAHLGAQKGRFQANQANMLSGATDRNLRI
jgi:hypothetical protein